MTGVDRWRSSRRGWAITAAVLAATVCLACWPRPTLGVLGIVVGTGALLAGLRGLLAEHCSQAPAEPSDDLTAQEARDLADDRCCVCGGPETPYENYRGQLFCWPCADCPCGQVPCVRTGINDPAVSAQAANRPDASGRDPETARTHPDAGGEQRADQGGDHPDAIRTTLPIGVQKALDADPALRAEYQRLRLMLRASRDVRQGLRDELAALHQGEEPYTDEATVPTPAQWIWRWNHATPAERLEYADCALTAAERLVTAHHVVLRFGDRDDALAVQVRAALLGEPLPVVHRTTEQQASGPHQVDESAGQPGAVVHETPITPPLTGPMIPTESPTCGTNLPATDGIPCGEPAAWHIRWAPGAPGDETFPAGLACHAHMDALAERHAWHERHAAGPDCGTRTADWTPDRCTPVEEA